MYAVEFRAKIKNGVIELPKRLKGTIADSVKVIILKEDHPRLETISSTEADFVARLLTTPLEMRDFHPLHRDEIYAR